MIRGKLFAVMLPLLLFAFVLVGCGWGELRQQTNGSTLIVLAASSLTDVLGELEGTFEEQNLGTDVQVSFASRSELLLQIHQGAPAGIFASADETKMDTAVEEGLVTEPEAFARNRPVVIVPTNNPAGIREFRDLAEKRTRS